MYCAFVVNVYCFVFNGTWFMSKKIFTSYYAKSGRDPLAFAISCKIPTYINNLNSFPALAPKWEFVLDQIKGTTTWEHYVERFMHLITVERKLNAQQIVDALPDGAILLCYERSDEAHECHRRLVAEWIEKETGIVVPEIGWNDSPPSAAELVLEW